MKIQLDTIAKTIKIDKQVKLSEFVDLVKKLLPDNAWKEYKLDGSPIVDYHNPIYWRYTTQQTWPWITPYVYYGSGGTTAGATTATLTTTGNNTVTTTASSNMADYTTGTYNITVG